MSTIDIRNHQGLIHKIARRYRWSLGPGWDYEDIVSEGNIGLCKAIEMYDPNHPSGAGFATYAQNWVNQYIRKACEDQSRTVRIPRNKRTVFWKEGTPMPNHGASLDTPSPDGVSRLDALAIDWANPLSNVTELDDSIDQARALERLRKKALRLLSPKKLRVFEGVFARGLKFSEVAKEMGCSRERVRQAHREIVSVLSVACGTTSC